eukprot:TRINITY_DN23528_c1_g2_i2.p2 TRINITY_DN23528_c1_g2~~TRINITY_DN23528_c1_g2_i2.p2  ORF type:complete len:327 (+),score=30.37 TRINITY_DN23528_c1_g2_i2:174-1154(+)
MTSLLGMLPFKPQVSHPPTFDIQFEDEDLSLDSSLNNQTNQEQLNHIITKMEKYGIYEKLTKLGFNSLITNLNREPYVSRITISDQQTRYTHEEDHYLIDIYYRTKSNKLTDFGAVSQLRKQRSAPLRSERMGWMQTFFSACTGHVKHARNAQNVHDQVGVLVTEYCRCQDVTKPLHGRGDTSRGLPGQFHPGLGVLKPIAQFLIDLTSQSEDFVVNYPEYWHNAFMYSSQKCFFLDPFYEAYCREITKALQKDIQGKNFENAAWKVVDGNVKSIKFGDGKVIWDKRCGEQIIPCSERAKKAWEQLQPQYEQLVQKCQERLNFFAQ